MTGQSTASYSFLSGTIRSSINARTPVANEIAAGRRPNAAPAIARTITSMDRIVFRRSGILIGRGASGTQAKPDANPASESGSPCSSNRSPALIGLERRRLTERLPRREIANRFRPYRVRRWTSLVERPISLEFGITTSSRNTVSAVSPSSSTGSFSLPSFTLLSGFDCSSSTRPRLASADPMDSGSASMIRTSSGRSTRRAFGAEIRNSLRIIPITCASASSSTFSTARSVLPTARALSVTRASIR